jgi:hypothetical protein
VCFDHFSEGTIARSIANMIISRDQKVCFDHVSDWQIARSIANLIKSR